LVIESFRGAPKARTPESILRTINGSVRLSASTLLRRMDSGSPLRGVRNDEN
jgi:hypothetical protein